MPLRVMHYSFNGGEISPELDGRVDLERYGRSLRTCENFTARPKGGVRRRPGLRYVGTLTDQTRQARLEKFEFSTTQAYVLVFGHLTLQIVRSGAFLPVTLVTPYTESQVFALQVAQSADVLWIVHPSHQPRKLLRYSDSHWQLQVIAFDPAPSVEADTIYVPTLTLSAVSGTSVTATASSAVFLDGDVDRQLRIVDPALASQGRAIIIALNSAAPSASVTLNVLTAFPSTSLGANQWALTGSPTLRLKPNKAGPKGAEVELTLSRRDKVASELVANGDFPAALTSWTNHSGATLASGTHTGGTNAGVTLTDSTKNFVAAGVRPGARVTNTTDGSVGTISAFGVNSDTLTCAPTLAGGTDNQWQAGDAYTIVNTGAAQVVDGKAQLVGGAQGIGWIEQGIATAAGQAYRLTFDVSEGPISAQVGASSKASDLAAEATFAIGLAREILFTAAGATSYLQFRNTQPTPARVDHVSAKNISALGWLATDLYKYVKVNGGVVQLTNITSGTLAKGHIQSELTSDAEALAGTWTLEVEAWSASRGFPRTVSFHQQRLCYAGTAAQPLTVWASKTGEYDNFGVGALADDSLEHEISANRMNTLLWLEPFRDLLMGTATGEHLLRGVNGPLTPANGEQLPQTNVGSDGLRPLRVDNALILLQRGKRQLMELNYDENGAVVRGPDLTLWADHITTGGLTQLALQSKPVAVLWAVRADGQLLGLTYEQVEQVQGWHRQTTQGVIESVCVVPVNSPIDEHTEAVYAVVRRTVAGATVRYVERLDPALQVDAGLSYSGALATTLSGLSHLEGRTVQVVDRSSGQAAVRPEAVVIGGQITVSPGVTAADVGLGYTSTLTTLRPEVPLRDGTLQGRRKRWVKILARLLDSVGLTINGRVVPFRTPLDDLGAGLAPRDVDVELVNFGWDAEGLITLTQPQPLPSTILALVGTLEVEES